MYVLGTSKVRCGWFNIKDNNRLKNISVLKWHERIDIIKGYNAVK